MSIPNEALQKVSFPEYPPPPQTWKETAKIQLIVGLTAQLVQEIESQAISSQREINVVKTAVATKQRDVRMLELTASELKQLGKDTKVYDGVGKMYVEGFFCIIFGAKFLDFSISFSYSDVRGRARFQSPRYS